MISGMRALDRGGRLGDRAHLHLEQAGDDQPETDAAQAQHRVLLVHPVHRGEQLLVVLVALARGHLDRQLLQRRKELVQRRVDEPDRDRQVLHRLEDLDEVVALQGKQGVESRLLLGLAECQDQPLDQGTPVAEEHVLGPGQADALRAETTGPRRVLAGVGVGAHLQAPLGSRRGVTIRWTAPTRASSCGLSEPSK